MVEEHHGDGLRKGRHRQVSTEGNFNAVSSLRALRLLWLPLWLSLSACHASTLPLASEVDIDRFMGDWYVIASIPTRLERGAHGARESYRRAPDGRILTTFRFRLGSFDGSPREYHPVGFIDPESHGAVWGMRFVRPIRADYRVMYVDDQYRLTLIGREQRDYAWIMARTPSISNADLDRMSALLSHAGYDASKLRRVPQAGVP
jgi:apolipoprotein D and lipocalin family protein